MGPLRPSLAAAAALLALAAPASAYPLGSGATPAPRDPLVAMQVSGGFTGGADYLGIARGRGRSRLDNRQGSHWFRVPSSRLRSLRAALRAAHWRGLRAQYRAPRPMADRLHYTILYDGTSVRTEDGARNPRRLQRVLDILVRIAGHHGGFL